jgi:hypothetical protein
MPRADLIAVENLVHLQLLFVKKLLIFNFRYKEVAINFPYFVYYYSEFDLIPEQSE